MEITKCPPMKARSEASWQLEQSRKYWNRTLKKKKKKKEEPDPLSFYKSQAWLRLRYDTLKRLGAKCALCGADGYTAHMHVDHIKPRSLYPELELNPDNLQILCASCNIGKSNFDEINWMTTLLEKNKIPLQEETSSAGNDEKN